MARVTIKELENKIQDLEEQLKEQNNINLELNKKINIMQEKGDNSFLNSALHKQLLRENRALKATVESKDRIIKQLDQDILKLKVDNSRLNGDIAHKIIDKNKLIEEIDILNNEIKLHDIFYKDNNTIKKQLDDTLILSARQSVKIQQMEKEIEELKTNSVQKIKNERGAGRKPKINDDIIRTVKMLSLQNKSMREISKEINLSLGTVQKIISEHKN